MSANGQFFVGAQMTLRLQHTTQIISGVSFITANVAYTGTNKTKIVLIEMELLFYPRWMHFMFTCVLGRYVAFAVLLVPKTFWRALTALLDSCAEIKSALSVVLPILAELEEGAGKQCSECVWNVLGGEGGGGTKKKTCLFLSSF